MVKLMMDVDGVLADFDRPYVQLLQEVSGKDAGVPEDWRPSTWEFAHTLGFSAEDERAAWHAIRESNNTFYYNQPDLPECCDALDLLEKGSMEKGWNVYFLTKRPGIWAKYWTELWLAERGMTNPTVITTDGEKGPICSVLGITHALDDSSANVLNIALHCPKAQVALYPCPWNTDMQERIRTGERDFDVQIAPSVVGWLAQVQ